MDNRIIVNYVVEGVCQRDVWTNGPYRVNVFEGMLNIHQDETGQHIAYKDGAWFRYVIGSDSQENNVTTESH